MNKGRENYALGESAGLAKLSTASVVEIKNLIKCGIKCSIIARRFSMTHSAIQHIKFGRSWGHVVV
jgi:hypothetical protein